MSKSMYHINAICPYAFGYFNFLILQSNMLGIFKTEPVCDIRVYPDFIFGHHVHKNSIGLSTRKGMHRGSTEQKSEITRRRLLRFIVFRNRIKSSLLELRRIELNFTRGCIEFRFNPLFKKYRGRSEE